jgi:hypothetical protein
MSYVHFLVACLPLVVGCTSLVWVQPEPTVTIPLKSDDPPRPLGSILANDFRRGTAAFRNREFEAAHLEFSRVVWRAPMWPNGHFNRGLTFVELSEPDSARADFAQYLRLAPNAPDREAVQSLMEALKSRYERKVSAGRTILFVELATLLGLAVVYMIGEADEFSIGVSGR